MSLIETALKKLQRNGNAAAGETAHGRTTRVPATPRAASAASPLPVARKKRIAVDGPKHHVDLDALVAGGLVARLDQASAVANEFRKIKRPLIANATAQGDGVDAHINVIMITSPLPNAGKTFCTVNLAVSMSLERELNVLLVDADVAKPHISRAFGLADAPGLIDLLVDESLAISDMMVRTDLNDIQVLPAGRHHPQATELLASERMSHIVREFSTRYTDRIVLLDSPPLLITSEAQALASQVGQITLVVEAGRTSHQELAQTIDALDETKAVNLILNKTSKWSHAREYGGEYGYGSYEGN